MSTKLTLDQDIQAIVDAVHAPGAQEYCDMTVAQARASHNEKAGVLGAPHVDLADVRELTIPVPGTGIPARAYRPVEGDAALPTLVFFHGGGHVIGSLDSYDTLCRQIALQSGQLVVSVDYRMAPEHRFPTAVEDSFATFRWVVEQGSQIGADADAVSLGGDSAGGNLAAVVAIMARDAGLPRAAHQLLVYPATGAYPDTPSQLEFAEGHVLTRRLILWFHRHYLAYEDHTDPRWAPLLTPSLADLPPATIILAACDPLRDEGIAYARRLSEEGNDVTLKVYSGVTHPFFSWSGALPKARDAVAFAASQLAASVA